MKKLVIACLIWLITTVVMAAEPKDTLSIGNHYFTSENCSACQLQAPVIRKLEKEGYTFYTYNYKTDKEMFEKHNIDVVPYFIIIRDGEEILELKGYLSYKTLSAILYKDESKIMKMIKRIKKLIEKGQ